MRPSDNLTKELRDACATYRSAVRVSGPLHNGRHYAELECGHTTRGSVVNIPTIGSQQFCELCTALKLDKIGD